MLRLSRCGSLGLCCWLLTSVVQAEEGYRLHQFERQQLTDVYFSEGANAGDLNNDGAMDVVYGPYWFAGPDYKSKHELYPPVPQDRNRYADNFFSWVHDFTGDGLNDVFVVGFPGTPAYVYENPGVEKHDAHWKKHQVFDWVSNESPQVVDVTGDGRPELVCTRDGFFGFATVNWEKPLEPWQFHPISERIAAERFGHGLGVGDVNSDGRMDIVHMDGWFEQPADNVLNGRWRLHSHKFSNAYGGADMLVTDVDGDGDSDIITSHAAHDFGLGWYEQVQVNGTTEFRHHLIMGAHPSENAYGVVFSELHSLALVDVDHDGLKDIVTGKTYYSHHRQSPMWDAGAVVYWFKLVRSEEGVQWIPYQIDGEAGIGRQLSVADVNGDGWADFVLGGMVGGHVLIHQPKEVDKATWQAAQPKPYDGPKLPSISDAKALRGPKPTFETNSGQVENGIEAEAASVTVSAGKTGTQEMSGFGEGVWSGNRQLFWTGGSIGDTLTWELPVESAANGLEICMTCASDYAVVQLYIDDEPLGPPIDLYDREVTSSGLIRFPDVQLTKGAHQLKIQIVGASPKAQPRYFVGIDFIRLGQTKNAE